MATGCSPPCAGALLLRPCAIHALAAITTMKGGVVCPAAAGGPRPSLRANGGERTRMVPTPDRSDRAALFLAGPTLATRPWIRFRRPQHSLGGTTATPVRGRTVRSQRLTSRLTSRPGVKVSANGRPDRGSSNRTQPARATCSTPRIRSSRSGTSPTSRLSTSSKWIRTDARHSNKPNHNIPTFGMIDGNISLRASPRANDNATTPMEFRAHCHKDLC
jgi:hypothetical protein